uniref:Uncharacterized protein n=1 Tax=viral metagenome TaxID=1070528 RepID=A0A6H1ZNS3_9ZZZZ
MKFLITRIKESGREFKIMRETIPSDHDSFWRLGYAVFLMFEDFEADEVSIVQLKEGGKKNAEAGRE